MHQVVQADMQSEREALGGVLEDDDMELLENSDDKGNDDNDNSGSSSGEEPAAKGSGRGNNKKKSKVSTPKKGNKYDDDEDYDEDAPSDTNNDSDDDDDMSNYEEESENDMPKRQTARRNKSSKPTSYKDVDEREEEIGTADEDSNDEATGPSLLMSPAKKSSAAGSYGSPSSRARARARMGRTPLDVHENGASDESESDFNEGRKAKKKTKPKKKRRKLSANSDNDSDSDYSDRSNDSSAEGESANQKRPPPQHALLKSRQSPTKLKTTHINCPSTTDDITMMNLPKSKPHVCYIAPDGKSRHCFTLDTLYRIAISSKSSNNDDAAANALAALDSGKLNFLQPPHFRSPMEDDLVDQIASRFGRGALVIEKSAVYKKMMGQYGGGSRLSSGMDDELDEFDEDGEYIGYNTHNTAGGGATTTNFQDRFERYMQSLMGSNDVYCCPLCYNEADRRLGNATDEEMWEDDESTTAGESGHENDGGEDRFSFLDDPLTILSSLDHEEFQVASTFCFRLLSGVKNHLKVVHGVNTKEVVGNDLFQRFQIRASDGLLQSWLRKSLRQNTVQGDMMRYWLNGENQSFVLLLSQIDKGRLRGEQSGEYGSNFSNSFPNRARRIWRDVSAPYLKVHDMDDFIAEEGDEEVEDEEDEGAAAGVPVNPNFTPPDAKGGDFKSPEERMMEHLQKKNRRKQNFNDSDDSSGKSNGDNDGASSDDDDLEVLPKPQQYEEVEDEDEWTKSKRFNSAKKAKQNLKSTGDEESEDDNVFDSDAEKPKQPKAQMNGVAAGKRVIDDGNEFDSDTEKPKPKAPMNSGSARKRVIESSDEESF
mmetsp:Transcript_31199/g.65789  ORF Transcript_31199/g.65789 Transcript_31199/m.65789 type:complete len:823 (-) Transcript_31199:108-2576(-)